MMARVIKVIEVERTFGTGTPDDPMYLGREYWSVKGELLAVCDPRPTNVDKEPK